jgi:hypothetical protein
MSKLSKQAEVFDKIKEMITKQAEAVKAVSIDPAVAKEQATAKNEVTPESLNDKQKAIQTPSTDSAAPAKSASEVTVEAAKEGEPSTEEAKEKAEKVVKKMEPIPGEKKSEENGDVSKLGQEILDAVTKMASKAAPSAGVSEATQHVNQNAVTPESLNDKQKATQKPSTDPAAPVKKVATDEEAEKIASYQLGVMLAEQYNLLAKQEKLAVYKEAGKRDLENMIAKASAALEKEGKIEKKAEEEVSPELVKQAEEAGKQAFMNILKQAEAEYKQAELEKQAAAQWKQMQDKVAALEQEKQAILKEASERVFASEQKVAVKEAEEKENQKMAAWADMITRNTIEQIKAELLKNNS